MRGIGVLLRSTLAFVFLTSTFYGQPASHTPSQTHRVVVKLRAPLAADVEAELPMSQLALSAGGTHSSHVQAFMARHPVRTLAPLYGDLVRIKKQTGLTEAEIVARVKQKFARRAQRFASTAAPPEISRTYVLELNTGSEAELKRHLDQLKADPEIEFAEPDHVVRSSQQLPNDPYLSSSGSWGQSYGDLWGILAIGGPAAWNTNAGDGIVVAVVDTGIDYNHPDIAANVWINTKEIPNNGIDDDNNGYVDDVRGWDFIGSTYQTPTQSNDPIDRMGHGTHVAGTIAAVGNNGIGIIGVAWRAKVMAVKGLDDSGFGLDSTLGPAIIYAANNGAEVISNSWAGQGSSQTISDAISYAYNLGAVIVAAAGNNSDDARNYFPANLPQVITVSAWNPNGFLAPFSNWGSKIDVAAPGVDILSLRAAGTSLGKPLTSDYTRADGTSMATPHVSGVAALILAQHPTYSNEDVRQAIRVSASGGGQFNLDTGYGLISASGALSVASVLDAKIKSPVDGVHISSATTISGVAQGPGFAQYVLEYGSGHLPTSWTLIQSSTTPVSNGTLGVFDPSALPDGPYTIRLTATDASNHAFVDRAEVVVDYVAITIPQPPRVPVTATVFKPGTIITITGTATGPSFRDFRIEWAEGINPASGWSTSGITLAGVTGGGVSPVTNGTVGTWDTSSITTADYYTLRLSVDNAGFTSQATTLVYLEPSLISSNWPKALSQSPDLTSGFVALRLPPSAPSWNELWLENPMYLGSPLPAQLSEFSADGSSPHTFSLDRGSSLQPAAGSLNGDGANQLVAADTNLLEVFQTNFSSSTLSPPINANFQRSQIVLADLNNDFKPEVVALGQDHLNHNAYLFAWLQNGQQLNSNFPIFIPDQNTNLALLNAGPRVLVGDLQGFGTPRIIVQEGTSATGFSLGLFANDGTPLSWQAPAYDGTPDQMVLADLDNNGQLEVLLTVTTSTQKILHVLQPDGTERPGWPVTLAHQNYNAFLAVGDLDRDGRKEIVISNGDHLYIFEPDATPFSGAWPLIDPSGDPFGPIALADINHDGYPEVLTTRGNFASSPNPLLAASTGASTQDSPTVTGINLAAESTVNSDGTLTRTIRSEASAQAYPSNTYSAPVLLALRQDGSVARSWNLLGANGNQPHYLAKILVGDFGGGYTDIAVNYFTIEGGGISGFLQEGVAMVLNTGAVSNPVANDWPMIYQNPANTTFSPPNPNTPTVLFTSPAANSTVQGVVTVNAAGNDSSSIAGVQFQLDGNSLGGLIASSPYTINWDTSVVSLGSHMLRAIMYDSAGQVIVSHPLPVTVAASISGSASPTALAFGGTAIGATSAPQAVTFTNTGIMTAVISSIQITGNFAQTNNCGPSVAPGVSCTINVTYSPTASGNTSGSMVIQGNFQTPSPTVFLSGTGLTISASLTPSTLNLGSQPQNTTSASQALTYTNTGDLPVSISGIAITGDFGQTNNCPASLAVSSSCTINVTFTPTATGTRSGTISVSGNAPASAALTGTGAAPIVSPTALNFGNQTVSTSATQLVTITNSTGSSFFISGWGIGGPYSVVNNCPFTIAVGATCTFSVTFTPQGLGTWNGTLTIQGSFPGSPASVSLTGNGTATQGTFNPTTLSFSSQAVGSTSAGKSLFFFNTGNTNLNLTGFVVTGDFAQTNNCPASMTPNTSCTLTVTFTPTADGSRSGTVTAQGNFTSGAPSMGLSGTGVIPVASLSPSSLMFAGQIVGTRSATQAVTLTNSGDGTLTIGQISASGDFAQANNCATSLAVGASCTISVSFAPTATGSRSGSLIVTSNGTPASSSISMTGTGTAPVAVFSPASLAFAAQAVNTSSAAQSVTLSNSGTAPLSVTSIAASGDFSQSNNCGTSVAAGASCTINLVFTPTTIGNRSGSLTLSSNSNPAPAAVTLSGTGTAAVATLSPGSLSFSSQLLGTSSSAQSVTLSNTGNVALSISSISIAGDFTQTNTCAASLDPGASCTINVVFSPTTIGSRTGSLSLTSNSNTAPAPVSLSGTGLAAVAALSPSSLAFGTQTVGTSTASQAVTLTNSGNTLLSISSLQTSGDFSQTNNCGTSLNAGASCTINVVFSPAALGSRTGSLSLSSNSNPAPTAVSLSGAGLAAVATLSPSSLAFPSQAVGSSSGGQAVTLTNNGNTSLSISSLTTSGDFSQANNCGTSLAAGASCTINVVFSPTVVGNRSGSLSLSSNSNPAPAAVNLSGTGIGAIASLSPASLTFGSQLVGTSSSAQAVTLSNTGNAALTISSLVMAGDFSQSNNCGTSLAAGGSCTVNVTFTPTARGSRSGSLVLNSNTTGAQPKVNLSGTGIAPVANLSPASLTFANQVVNTTSAAQTVTLTNSGDAALNISSIAIASDFAQTNNCGSSLAAGTSCTLNVTFKPLGSGLRSGSLTISDNASGNPHMVSLSGTGLDYTLSTSPSSATVNAGGTASYTLTATAQGGSWSTAISLSCSGLPAASTCSFTPTSVTPGSGSATSTFKIVTTSRHGSNGTPAGTYTVTIKGASGSTQHSTTVTLVVK
jgi:subtilisin family serine protease